MNNSFPFLSLDVITADTSNTPVEYQRNASWDRSVQQVNKNTHLAIRRELYCCTNSIMRKDDLENTASDPKLIGVIEAGDPS